MRGGYQRNRKSRKEEKEKEKEKRKEKIQKRSQRKEMENCLQRWSNVKKREKEEKRTANRREKRSEKLEIKGRNSSEKRKGGKGGKGDILILILNTCSELYQISLYMNEGYYEMLLLCYYYIWSSGIDSGSSCFLYDETGCVLSWIDI